MVKVGDVVRATLEEGTHMTHEQIISLVVKGSEEDAVNAAKAHGFDKVRVSHVFEVSRMVRLAARAGANGTALASAWFCEPSDPLPGEGHPAGALLFYQEARS